MKSCVCCYASCLAHTKLVVCKSFLFVIVNNEWSSRNSSSSTNSRILHHIIFFCSESPSTAVDAVFIFILSSAAVFFNHSNAAILPSISAYAASNPSNLSEFPFCISLYSFSSCSTVLIFDRRLSGKAVSIFDAAAAA